MLSRGNSGKPVANPKEIIPAVTTAAGNFMLLNNEVAAEAKSPSCSIEVYTTVAAASARNIAAFNCVVVVVVVVVVDEEKEVGIIIREWS